MDGQKYFLHSNFDVMCFGYTATTKKLAYLKPGGVSTKKKNSMENGAASAGG